MALCFIAPTALQRAFPRFVREIRTRPSPVGGRLSPARGHSRFARQNLPLATRLQPRRAMRTNAIVLLVLVIALLLLATHSEAQSKKYTLAELRALVDAKSYDEAIRHLGDIAPQDRKADWI